MLALTLAAVAAQGALSPVNRLPLPAEKSEFTFVALGDNRPAGSGQPPTSVYREILKEVAWIHPAFVISSGDLIYGNEESIGQYKQECAWIQPLLRQLGVPYFNAPGNHEINGRSDFESEYQKELGPLYGSFDFGGWRFIALATDTAKYTAEFGPEQISWLNSALAAKKPAVVFEHRPFFPRNGNDEKGAGVANGTELSKVLAAGNVKIVFEGHDHVFNHQSHDGIQYYIAGGAGAPLDASPEDGGFFHFILVHVHGDQFDVDVIPLGSIALSQNGSDIRVSSYVDATVPLGDLVVNWPTKPKSISAAYDKKGKLKKVDARIVSVDGSKGAYRVHLALPLEKHRQTLIRLG